MRQETDTQLVVSTNDRALAIKLLKGSKHALLLVADAGTEQVNLVNIAPEGHGLSTFVALINVLRRFTPQVLQRLIDEASREDMEEAMVILQEDGCQGEQPYTNRHLAN